MFLAVYPTITQMLEQQVVAHRPIWFLKIFSYCIVHFVAYGRSQTTMNSKPMRGWTDSDIELPLKSHRFMVVPDVVICFNGGMMLRNLLRINIVMVTAKELMLRSLTAMECYCYCLL